MTEEEDDTGREVFGSIVTALADKLYDKMIESNKLGEERSHREERKVRALESVAETLKSMDEKMIMSEATEV